MELVHVERQMKELAARRDLLWRFVNSSRDLIQHEDGSGSEALKSAADIIQSPIPGYSLIVPNNSSVALPYGRLWEAVRIVMHTAQRPLAVPEIVALLEKSKVIVPGDHPKETVRSAISRKDDVFEKVDRGFYVLKSWPAKIKQMRRDEQVSDVA